MCWLGDPGLHEAERFFFLVVRAIFLKSLHSKPPFLSPLQPSDSRKSISSDSGVVSPAENVDDHKLLQQKSPPKQQPLLQQQEKKKKDEVGDLYSRKQGGRATSGSAGSGKSSSKGFSNLPSCNSSDSGQGSEPADGLKYTYHFHVPSELTG